MKKPQAKTTSKGKQICSDCSPGNYSAHTGKSQSSSGQTLCVECSPSEFNDAAGAIRCTVCPHTPYFHGKGRNNSCIACPIGWSSEVGSAKCGACGAGTFGIGCKNCPLGFARKGDDGDAMQCQQWESGETTMVEGAAQFDDCDTGTCGQTKRGCSACPTGFYQNNKGETEGIAFNSIFFHFHSSFSIFLRFNCLSIDLLSIFFSFNLLSILSFSFSFIFQSSSFSIFL